MHDSASVILNQRSVSLTCTIVHENRKKKPSAEC